MSRSSLPEGTLELLLELRPDVEISWFKGMPVRLVLEKTLAERDGEQRCGICGGLPDGGGYDFDHIIPLARGGAHHIDNMQFAHSSCNRSKGDKLPHETQMAIKQEELLRRLQQGLEAPQTDLRTS